MFKVEVIAGGIFRKSELVSATYDHVFRAWTNEGGILTPRRLAQSERSLSTLGVDRKYSCPCGMEVGKGSTAMSHS